MHGIILHHYDASPFTQKALRMLGLKSLAWRSVLMPMVMPKPDLLRLTGGYRGTPVMQIGADIYIDTQRIARELEERFPDPTLFPAQDAGLGYALVKWSDQFFQAGLTMALALLGPEWPEAFRRDREAIFKGLDVARAKANLDHAQAQFRACAALLDEQLADGRPFLTGEAPALADIQAFGVPWFTRAALAVADRLLAQFRHLPPWEARVAALGEGTRCEITAAEAEAEARAACPDLSVAVDDADAQGLRPGMRVRVEPDDFSDRGAVEGEVLRASALAIAVHRRSDALGDVVVHFPRLGYRVTPIG
jgi:glutathione S-transferase